MLNQNKFPPFVFPLLFLFVVFLYFFMLHQIPLYSDDEGRYAEIAREMWESKNFITPHFNYMQYLEKPVLAPFVTSLSFGLFGVSHLTARLPGVLCALLGIIMCFYFTQKYFTERIAFFSFLILSTSLGYFLVGRYAIIDIILTFVLCSSLFFMMDAYFSRERSGYLLAYFFMGLGFLAKGLIGIVLPTIVFGAFLIWERNLKELLKMHIPWGVLILAITIGPWLFAISLEAPEFLDVFILQHHFSRYTTEQFARSQPIWFFIPVILVCSFPWSLFLPASLQAALKEKGELASKYRFIICWIVMIFLFFSLPKAKLVYYMIPLAMPISILLAGLFDQWISDGLKQTKSFDIAWFVMVFICTLAPIGLLIYTFGFSGDKELIAVKSILPWISLVLIVGSSAAFFFFKRGERQKSFITTLVMMLGVFLLIPPAMYLLSRVQSTYENTQLIESLADDDSLIGIFSSPDHFSDFPFHLRKRVHVIGSDRGTLRRESLQKENRPHADNWFIGLDQFVREFNARDRKVFCLMDDYKLKYILERGLGKYNILQNRNGKILISNIA